MHTCITKCCSRCGYVCSRCCLHPLASSLRFTYGGARLNSQSDYEQMKLMVISRLLAKPHSRARDCSKLTVTMEHYCTHLKTGRGGPLLKSEATDCPASHAVEAVRRTATSSVTHQQREINGQAAGQRRGRSKQATRWRTNKRR